MKKVSDKKAVLITIVICFLYAVSDEVHQYFVPGRACRLLDVIIDTSGCAFFCFVYLFLKRIFKNKSSKN